MMRISGTYLAIDGYVQDGAVLNPDTICSLFDDLVKKLNMKYLLRPIAMRVPLDPEKLGGDDDDGGWSVICQITTSHIALHSWPLRRAFMMDIFSCKPFDVDKAIDLVEAHLGISSSIVNKIDRTEPIR